MAEAVDKHRLAGRLLVDILNDSGRERLADFSGILPEQFLHLCQCEIWQVELVLDVKRRDSPVVTELRDVLDSDDDDAERTSRRSIRKVDVPQCMQETAHRVARDGIKLVNDKHHPLFGLLQIQQWSQLFKKFCHHKPSGKISIL